METVLGQKDERGVKAMLLEELDLAQVLDRDVEHLSGARHTLPCAWCPRCKPAPAQTRWPCSERDEVVSLVVCGEPHGRQSQGVRLMVYRGSGYAACMVIMHDMSSARHHTGS